MHCNPADAICRALKPLSLSGRPARTAEPELVILDVMLPGEDGFSILKKPAIPCSAPTAHHHGYSKIQRAGYRARLDCGADDYITKPFGIMEFLSRVRAALRRSAPRKAECLCLP